MSGKGLKNIKRAKTRQEATVLPPMMGGHRLAHVMVGKTLRWKCSECLCWSASWAKLAPLKCSGKAVAKWTNKRQAVAMTGGANNQMQAAAMTDWCGNQMQAVAMTGAGGGGECRHKLVKSGEVVWCKVCASYADTKAHIRGIGGSCRGPPVRKGPHDYGGMWGQLQKLRAGKHPKTGEVLPPPVDCTTVEEDLSLKRYARLDLRNEASNSLSIVPFDPDHHFVPYVPEPSKTLRPNEGRTAKAKMADMLIRVQQKQVNTRKIFRLRGKQRPPAKNEQAVDAVDTGGNAVINRSICWVTRRRIECANG